MLLFLIVVALGLAKYEIAVDFDKKCIIDIYGIFCDIEDEILEIIRSPDFDRLKYVSQYGFWVDLLGSDESYSRWTHCMGAMLVERKVCKDSYANCLMRQIGYLLHDVAHTAGSHSTESLFGPYFHDKNNTDIIRLTGLPEILERIIANHPNDIAKTWEDLFDRKNIPTFRAKRPGVNSDRADYTMRDACLYGHDYVRFLFDEMYEHESGEIAFKNDVKYLALLSGEMSPMVYFRPDRFVINESVIEMLKRLKEEHFAGNETFYFDVVVNKKDSDVINLILQYYPWYDCIRHTNVSENISIVSEERAEIKNKDSLFLFINPLTNSNERTLDMKASATTEYLAEYWRKYLSEKNIAISWQNKCLQDIFDTKIVWTQ